METKTSGTSLIERREIILRKDRKQLNDSGKQENEQITIDTLSQEYKTLQQKFNELSLQKNEGEVLISKQEAKIAIQRYRSSLVYLQTFQKNLFR